MRLSETPVHGAFIVEPEPHGDQRGFFARVWCRREFAERGLDADFVQCNSSFSAARGTLRGLHYQEAPHDEVKLMSCTRGAIFDVMVDLRPESPSYLRWFGLELTAENRRMLYVPRGCAHGYLTVQDDSEVMYPVTAYYHPQAERGVRWNDPLFQIAWPAGGPSTISDKDRAWPDYQA
jgi:dTDP-4-dehydrorhamnose 3,5-epimerase